MTNLLILSTADLPSIKGLVVAGQEQDFAQVNVCCELM